MKFSVWRLVAELDKGNKFRFGKGGMISDYLLRKFSPDGHFESIEQELIFKVGLLTSCGDRISVKHKGMVDIIK